MLRDCQVRAVEDGFQEPPRRAPARAALLRHVEIGAARIVAAVEVAHARHADLGCGLREGVQHRPAHGRRLHPQLPALAVQRAGGIDVVFLGEEVRQHVVPAPAIEAELAPAVIVGGLAAHVDHGVDGRRSAQHLASGIVDDAAVQARIGLRLEHPVRARIADGEEIADGDLQPDPVVIAARLQEQDADLRVRRQAVGQHASRRACARNDVVVSLATHVRSHRLRRRPEGRVAGG